MEKERYILYFGADESFLEDYTVFAKKYFQKTPFKIVEVHTAGDFVQNTFDEHPNLCLIDFSLKSKKEIKSICQILNYLKHLSSTFSIPFFSIFSNKNELLENQAVFTHGILASFIKGEDVEKFFQLTAYIGFNDSLSAPRFARARGINLPYDLLHLGMASHLSEELLMVSSDLHHEPGQSRNFNFCIDENFSGLTYTAEEDSEAASPYYATHSTLFSIPYPDPWAEITDGTLMKDTIQTWISFHSELLLPKKKNALVISSNQDLLKKVMLKEDKPFLFLSDGLKKSIPFIMSQKPNSIYLDLSTFVEPEKQPDLDSSKLTTEEELSHDIFQELENLLKEIKFADHYEPILVILGTPSKSDAFKKNYQYPSILAFHEPLSLEVLDKLLEIQAQKTASTPTTPDELLSFSDPEALFPCTELKVPVKIFSMTENELTFYSKEALPMYSVFKIEVPETFFVTLIPPYADLPPMLDHTHYMGFVHGGDFKDFMLLRNFINRIIFKPLTEFKALEEELTEQENNASPSSEMTQIQKESKNKNRYEVIRKPVYNGKSKL